MPTILTNPGVPIALPAIAVTVLAAWLLFRAAASSVRVALTADASRRQRARELAAAAAQYVLLFFFVAVAMGLSAQGLIAFARDNMRLAEPWPHLIFFALDGAAGMCAVLMARRAARGESAVAPRLAVWGIVAASATFNWEQAPANPGAHLGFAVFPIIAAVLFEFTLRETRRAVVRDAQRRLAGIRWLHPVERVRVLLALAADEQATATSATRRVRQAAAARRLYGLRLTLASGGRFKTARVRAAERRAQAALMRAGFTDPGEAVEVLRGVQVLTRARDLAGLDYTTADAARMVLTNLITDRPAAPARLPAAGPAAEPGGVPEPEPELGVPPVEWHATVACRQAIPETVPSGVPAATGTPDGTPGGTPPAGTDGTPDGVPGGTDDGTPEHAAGGTPPAPRPARRSSKPTKADETEARRVWREHHAAGVSLTDRGLVAAVDKRVGRTAAARIISEERAKVRESKAS